jgi:hypothetical protein
VGSLRLRRQSPGALYGHYFVTFGPDDFFFNQGFNIVLLTIVMLVVVA